MKMHSARMNVSLAAKALIALAIAFLLLAVCDVSSCEAGLRTRWQQRRSHRSGVVGHPTPATEPALAEDATPEIRIAYWTRKIANAPGNSEAYSKRAEAWLSIGQDDKGLSDLSMAIRLDPKQLDFYLMRANVFVNADRIEDALADLNKVLEIDPGNELGRMLRGVVGMAANVPVDQAADDLSLAAQQANESLSSWLIQLRGMQRLKQGQYSEAIADFTQYLEHAGDDPTALAGAELLRGSAFTESKQYELAIDDYSRVIDLLPEQSYGPIIMRAAAYASMGEYARALADYSTVITRWPERPYGYAHKAWALATYQADAIRDGHAAVQLATQACALDPSNRFSMQALAAAYAEQGDFEQAVEWQQKAIAAYGEQSKTSQPSHIIWSLTIGAPPSDDAKKQEAVARLESYRQNKPLRQ
jgi:tetratricopeptide (TPR) repeat protein